MRAQQLRVLDVLVEERYGCVDTGRPGRIVPVPVDVAGDLVGLVVDSDAPVDEYALREVIRCVRVAVPGVVRDVDVLGVAVVLRQLAKEDVALTLVLLIDRHDLVVLDHRDGEVRHGVVLHDGLEGFVPLRGLVPRKGLGHDADDEHDEYEDESRHDVGQLVLCTYQGGSDAHGSTSR